MGFVLLGLLAGVVNGNTLSAENAYSSAMFYMVTYVLTTLASFGSSCCWRAKGSRTRKSRISPG